jgi:hypothetical protein
MLRGTAERVFFQDDHSSSPSPPREEKGAGDEEAGAWRWNGWNHKISRSTSERQ